jgi:hypothetical protein
MYLSEQDAKLYFDLMWALQFHVNQTLKLVPGIPTLEQYIALPVESKLKVRTALYGDKTLFDQFVQANPRHFSAEQLAIVTDWQHFVADEFYIERILKKYTIFIGKDEKVYGVWGLHNDFDEMFHPSQLPMYVRTTLLPFQGKIIYDGLLQGYNVRFGGGISGNLKEIYLSAKQRGEIIENLGSSGVSAIEPATKAIKDLLPELEELLTRASKLRGGSGQPAIYSPIFSLIKASVELGHAATLNADNHEQLMQLLNKVEQSVRKVERTIHRSW